MSVISLTGRALREDGAFEVGVRFEGGGEHEAEVVDPLAADPDGERLLAWYFEEHLRYPHLDRDKERAAVALLASYGTTLFTQVFGASEGCSFEFQRMRAGGFDGLQLEVIGGADFHRLHWEALREDGAGTPFGVRVPIMRRVEDIDTGFDVTDQGAALNVLVVTARPSGSRDVGYRTISRPLLKALRSASVPVSVDLVRPGSWRALEKHLSAVTSKRGSGWYRIVHFDVHGAIADADELRGGAGGYLLSGDEAVKGNAEQAYLFFETAKEGVPEAVSTKRVANLLVEHRVPVAVLNACQSAMQSVGSEASLAQRLVEAGVPVSVGMAYSVTVSAAERMMPTVYEQLAGGMEIISAIHAGRRELFDEPARRAYFDQELDLEDWVLPVVFSQRPVEMQPQPADLDLEREIYARKAWQVEEPATEYGFVGRDLDVQAIERHLLGEDAHNQLLVSGMAGAGKSTLLGHLAWWWQETGLVERVFSFSYEHRAWTVDQIVQTIVSELLNGHEQMLAQNLPEDAQLERVATLLRAERHLLVLDNAESITATPASIPHSLAENERARLRRLLSRLRGGKTLVLVGSRGSEKWLANDTFGSNTYELGGLDPQATSILLDRIITRHGGALPDRDDERVALEELVGILGGYPLALTVVLPAIASTAPSVVLAELKQGGGEGADPAKIIQRAVEYSHGRLDPTTQNSLAVLAPFTGVVPKVALDLYLELLEQHQPVTELGELDLEGALNQAIDVGLASNVARSPNHIFLQPLFPYFLRTRLVGRPELVSAIARAHHDLYQQLGPSLHRLLVSREPNKRATGKALARVEYANLVSALEYALDSGAPVQPLVWPLDEYLDQVRQSHARQQLLERVIAAIGQPGTDERRIELASTHNLAGIAALAQHDLNAAREHHEAELALRAENDDPMGAARTYHQLGRVAEEQRRFGDAEAHYKKALEVKLDLGERYSAAVTYHQLGSIALEQRRFKEAEAHYKEALDIFVEFDDRYETADTYHQLGMVAEEQRRFEEAEAHYKEALEIFVEFDDPHRAADTHHQLGIVAHEQRRFGDAEAHYKEALEIKLEFGDRYSAAATYHQLGAIAQEQRRQEEAEAHYKRAAAIKLEFDDRHSAAITYHQLGTVAQDQGRFKEAEAHYRKALEIFVEFDDRYETGGTFHQLGTIAQEQGRFEEAEAHYRKALEIFVEFDDGYRAAMSGSQLGVLLTSLNRAEEAIRHSLAALLAIFELTTQWSERDLRLLKQQREQVGAEAFRAEVLLRSSESVFDRMNPLLDQVDVPEEK